jgi:hypothetical protein
MIDIDMSYCNKKNNIDMIFLNSNEHNPKDPRTFLYYFIESLSGSLNKE